MDQPLLHHAGLEGAKVLLRPVTPDDAPAAFELVHAEPRILDWLIWPGPRDTDEIATYYAQWVKQGERAASYLLAILDRASGRFAGCISLDFRDHPGTGTVGYWLGVPFWNGGRMTEAVGLIGHLAFEHCQAQLLSACVFDGNAASRRVLEHNGWTCDLPTPTRSCGEDRDQWHMGLDRPTWLAHEERVRPVREDVRRAPSPALPPG